MAIFVVDECFSETEGLVSLPYEFLPLPEKGQKVEALNRSGKVVCPGEIHRVVKTRDFDETAVVTVKIPKEYTGEVRDIQYGEEKHG
jgi:hypothetical protein